MLLHRLGPYLRRHRHGPKREALVSLRDYVGKRVAMTDSPSFRQLGYDCGSGPTESCCGTLTARLKGLGMRWDTPNAEGVMAFPLYRPDVVARLLCEQVGRIVYYRGTFYRCDGRAYEAIGEDALHGRMVQLISSRRWIKPGDDTAPQNIVPKTNDVREVCLQLKGRLLPDATEPPCWLDQRPEPNPRELLGVANGLLHVPTGRVHPHTDEFFCTSAAPYSYGAQAARPHRWLAFPADLFGEDHEAIRALQELFGYYLLPDTRQQKIGLIVGPRRSGKGTIARVLTGLLGARNVAGPTLNSLGTNFGLAALIDRSLAIISDARLSRQSDQGVILERLLSISGEDRQTIDRKYRSAWCGTLPTRFLILTNELPRLLDRSAALAGRFVMLVLRRSFYGREDTALTEKLLAELPGILRWAIEGWRRLHAGGRFVVPASSRESLAELEALGSPVRAFVAECCILGPQEAVEADALWQAWLRWCEANGREHPGTKQTFGRDLHAGVPGLDTRRPRAGGGRLRFYQGLSLRQPNEG